LRVLEKLDVADTSGWTRADAGHGCFDRDV